MIDMLLLFCVTSHLLGLEGKKAKKYIFSCDKYSSIQITLFQERRKNVALMVFRNIDSFRNNQVFL